MATDRKFWEVAAQRPFRTLGADGLRKVFEASADQNRDAIVIVCLVLLELEGHRKLWKRSGTRATPAGELFEQIQSYLDGLEWFMWPSTNAATGDGKLQNTDWGLDSPLSRLGYSVAKGGPTEGQRRRILRTAFLDALPTASNDEAKIWGLPNTGGRLRQIAHFIATLVRNNKRRGRPYRNAIGSWEADLSWMRKNFYDGRFDFPWPNP